MVAKKRKQQKHVKHQTYKKHKLKIANLGQTLVMVSVLVLFSGLIIVPWFFGDADVRRTVFFIGGGVGIVMLIASGIYYLFEQKLIKNWKDLLR